MAFPRRRNNRLILPLIVLLALAGLVVAWPRGRALLSRLGLAVFRPVGTAARYGGHLTGNIFSFMGSKRDLVRQNNVLTWQVEKLANENNLLRQAELENAKLRELLGWERQHANIIVTGAEVIGFVPEEWLNQAIINKGQAQGLSLGQGVISAQGIVGRIIEVKPKSSIVLLFTDTTSSFAAMCQRTGDRGLVSGRLCFPPTVSYISQGNDIQEGDQFVTAPGGQYFPAGLPIGTVIKKVTKPYELFDQIYLRPAVRVSQLDSVFIVRPMR